MSKYKVQKISCGHCTSVIERSIRPIDAAAHRTVLVGSALGDDAIRAAIRKAGYESTFA